MAFEALPLNILLGPLSPSLVTAEQSICNPLSSLHCLGDYFGHPQIQTFFIGSEALSHLYPAGQTIQSIVPAERLELPLQPSYLLQPLLDKIQPEFQPDLILWWGLQYGFPDDFQQVNLPKILIVSDWNPHHALLSELFGVFDYLLCDQKLIQIFAAQGRQNCAYWPAYAFDASRVPAETGAEREIDLIFVGNHNPHKYQQRNHYLSRMASLPYRTLIRSDLKHAEYVWLLQRSKIAFNFALRQEMNMRAYEAAACGALLLIEAENLEIQHYLTPGQDCVLYTPENFEQVIAYYLSHEDQRLAITRRARQRIETQTYTQQFATLLQRLPTILKEIQAQPKTLPLKPDVELSRLALSEQLQRAVLALSLDIPLLRINAALRLEKCLSQVQSAEQRLLLLNALLVCHTDLLLSPPEGVLPGFDWSLSALRHALVLLSESEGWQPIVVYNLAWSAYLIQQPLAQWLERWQQFDWNQEAAAPADLAIFVLPLRFMGFYQYYQAALISTQQTALTRYLQMGMLYLAGHAAEVTTGEVAALACFQAANEILPVAEIAFEQSRLYLQRGQKKAAFVALTTGLNGGVFYSRAWWALLQLGAELLPPAALQDLIRQALTLFQDQKYAPFRSRIQQQFGSIQP